MKHKYDVFILFFQILQKHAPLTQYGMKMNQKVDFAIVHTMGLTLI